MPFDITETVLPGVGKKYELYLDTDESIAVIIYSNGERELHHRTQRSDDYETLVELTDSQARTLGLFLVGAYYQPIAGSLPQSTEAGEHIEWYSITDDSPVAGTTLSKSGIDATGVTLLGLERDGDVDSSPPADCRLQVGDRLIIIGRSTAHDELEALLSDE